MKRTVKLQVESLESRDMPSVSPAWFATVASPGVTPRVIATSATTQVIDHQFVGLLRADLAARWGSPSAAAKTLRPLGIEVLRGTGRVGELVLRADGGSNEAARQKIAKTGFFTEVSADYVVRVAATANDPRYPDQYAPAKIGLPTAWDKSLGKGSIVAVIDTGVDYMHPDLQPNMWTNSREIAGNGRDDDGDGIVDDRFGADFFSQDGDPRDELTHGTHVAGIIAAVKDNNLGIAGVAPQAQIMALRAFGPYGGTASAVAAAINYVILMVNRGEPIRVVNMSFRSFESAPVEARAVAEAENVGLVMVAAAGNDGFGRPVFPAALPGVISVAATNSADQFAADYSNFGPTVVLAAPGSAILSTVPGGGYEYKTGTSMSAPQVAGAVALVASATGLRGQALANRIIQSVDVLPSLSGKVTTGGRLNVARAVGAQMLVAPQNLHAANVWEGRIDLNWNTVPGSTAYRIERLSSGVWMPVATTSRTAFACTGLATGTTYTFRVRAEVGATVSPWTTLSVATKAVLKAPVIFVDNVFSNAIDISWARVNAVRLFVEISSDNGRSWARLATISADSTRYRIRLLVSNRNYVVRLVAESTGASLTSNLLRVHTR